MYRKSKGHLRNKNVAPRLLLTVTLREKFISLLLAHLLQQIWSGWWGNGRARFHPAKFEEPSGGDFFLITGRLKNQWHTMTRTGKVPQLLKGEVPPFVIVNPSNARKMGVEEGDEVVLEAHRIKVTRIARFGNIKEGHLFTPFGYPREFGNPANLLVPVRLDPFSKEPALKEATVSIGRI